MSRGVNKVILLGHVGNDPDTRYTSNGTCVCNISLATSEQWSDKQSGEKRERTEWHRLVCWGKLGEIADQYVTKGKQLYVEGKIETEKWQDRDGNDRYTTKIRVSDLQLLGGGSERRQGGGQSRGQQRGGQRGGGRQPDLNQHPNPEQDDLDDDIPF